jgi:hypothetical protein
LVQEIWFTAGCLMSEAKPVPCPLLCSTGSGAARFPQKSRLHPSCLDAGNDPRVSGRDSGERPAEADGRCGNARRLKAYDAAKAGLENGDDELIPLEITERRLRGEPALRIRVCLQAYRKPQKMVPALAAAGSGETLTRASLG